MRKNRSLWNKFLSRIGPRKPCGKQKAGPGLPTRRLRLESLEARQLLSATLYWDPNGSAGLGGAGTWDTSSANWSPSPSGGGAMQAWSNGDSAVLAGSAAVNLGSAPIEAASIQIAKGATLNLNGQNLNVGGLTGGGIVTNNASGSGVSLLTLLPSAAASFCGTIENGTWQVELVMSGSGTQTLMGSNSYTGGTVITAGTLEAGSGTALGAANGILTVDGGTLNLDGYSLAVAQLTSGANDLTGLVTNTSAAPATLSIGGINAYDAFFGELQDNGVDHLGITVDPPVGGPYEFALYLYGTQNNYSGPTTINGGSGHYFAALLGSNTNALSPNSPVTVNGDSVLDLNAANTTIPSLAGSGRVMSNEAGVLTLTIDCTTSATCPVNIDCTMISPQQDVALDKAGGGTLTLTGKNTYGGGTTISGGSVIAGSAWALGSGAGPLTIDTACTLDLDGQSPTVGELQGGGTITDSAAGSSVTLTVDQASASSFSGTIQNGSSKFVAVTSSGSGVLTLSGTNKCTGPIAVSGGQLALGAGGALGNAAISVARAATFAASPNGGTVSAGTTGPGTAGATLTLPMGSLLDVSSVGSFKLQQETGFLGPALTLSGGTLVFALSSAGTGQMDVSSAASTSGTNIIGIQPLGASLTTSTYTLITAKGGLTGTFEFANGTANQALTVGGVAYVLTLGNSATAETVTVAIAAVMTQRPSGRTG